MDKSGPATELTKREYFAALAMQVLIIDDRINNSDVAEYAVEYADALLKELNRDGEKIPF